MRRHTRFILLFLLMFVAGGCYTQIRAPMQVADKSPPAPSRVESEVVVQRFEYYHHYGHPTLHGLYDFGRFYEPCLWPYDYDRYSYWGRVHVAWDYASWASVYHPFWRRYPPAVLVPYVVYSSPRRVHHVPDIIMPDVVVQQRPRIRRSGFEGEIPSAGEIRTDTQNTPNPQTTASGQNTSDTSKKQAPEKKKDEEEKEEKRTEKRSDRKKRGGMR